MAKLVQFTDTEGRPIWVNPDAVALLEEEEPGKTTLYFANADIPLVVIRGFAEKVVDALMLG
jgi:hypothetical protein